MPLNRLLLLLLFSIDALLLYTLPDSSISDNNQPENQRAKNGRLCHQASLYTLNILRPLLANYTLSQGPNQFLNLT